MKNVMIDLETLGTKPGSVILSIGAVKFGKEGLGDEFYAAIELDSATRSGLTIDASTVAWWMDQSEEARKVFTESPRDPLFAALKNLQTYLRKGCTESDVKIWGNGADFDNVLLAAAYDVVNLPVPWKFYNNRCYRTMKSMSAVPKPDREGVHHNALDDAKYQALHLVSILNGGR